MRRRFPHLFVVLVALGLLAGACSNGSSGGDSAGAKGNDGPKPKVTVAGDSISVGFGAALRTAAGTDLDVKVIGVEGSGLARPDFFDWPGRLTELAAQFPPAVLVFSVGSNDAQDLTDASGTVVARFSDQAAWDAEYKTRLAAVFDTFQDSPAGTKVVWLGHVVTKDPKVGQTNRRIHRLATEVAASRPWVRVDDLAGLLGTGEATATDCLVDDGLHLTTTCLDRAAAAERPTLPQG